jgi:hypothetical protein
MRKREEVTHMKKLLSWVIALFFLVSLAPAVTGAGTLADNPAGGSILLAKEKEKKDKKDKKKKKKTEIDSHRALV